MTLIDFVFPKLPTTKKRSDKCLKRLVSENTSTSNMVNVPQHCWNLHHSTFIKSNDHCPVNKVGKRSVISQFVNILAADEKYTLLKRNNLTIPIEMQLSQKHKTFSRFYTAFLKSRWTFEHFDKKKLMVMDFVISKLRTPKTYSEKCLKSHVWENPLTRNMVNVRKQCWNLHRSTFPIFIDHCQNNWLENVSLFAMQNLGTAC